MALEKPKAAGEKLCVPEDGLSASGMLAKQKHEGAESQDGAKEMMASNHCVKAEVSFL